MKHLLGLASLLLSLQVSFAYAGTATDLYERGSEKLNQLKAQGSIGYFINPIICQNSNGDITLMYSVDFRVQAAVVLTPGTNQVQSLPLDQLNIEPLDTIGTEDSLRLFKVKLGNVKLVCVESLMVLESVGG